MALTRSERETCVLVNDAGDATVWTTSTSYRRRLMKRLGQPTSVKGGLTRWDLPAGKLTWLPRKRVSGVKRSGKLGGFLKKRRSGVPLVAAEQFVLPKRAK